VTFSPEPVLQQRDPGRSSVPRSFANSSGIVTAQRLARFQSPPLAGPVGVRHAQAGHAWPSVGWVTGDSVEVQLAIGRPVPEGSILDQIR
jgi:hypothetical protein